MIQVVNQILALGRYEYPQIDLKKEAIGAWLKTFHITIESKYASFTWSLLNCVQMFIKVLSGIGAKHHRQEWEDLQLHIFCRESIFRWLTLVAYLPSIFLQISTLTIAYTHRIVCFCPNSRFKMSSRYDDDQSSDGQSGVQTPGSERGGAISQQMQQHQQYLGDIASGLPELPDVESDETRGI